MENKYVNLKKPIILVQMLDLPNVRSLLDNFYFIVLKYKYK